MITQCPNCATSFRVSSAQLAVARGAVRCGACLQVFPADEHMVAGVEDHPPRPQADQQMSLTEQEMVQDEVDQWDDQTEDKMFETEEKVVWTEQEILPTEDKTDSTEDKTDSTEDKTDSTEDKTDSSEDKMLSTEDEMTRTEEGMVGSGELTAQDEQTTELQAQQLELKVDQGEMGAESEAAARAALMHEATVAEATAAESATPEAKAAETDLSETPAFEVLAPAATSPEAAVPEAAGPVTAGDGSDNRWIAEPDSDADEGDQGVDRRSTPPAETPYATAAAEQPVDQPTRLSPDFNDRSSVEVLSEDEKLSIADNLGFDPEEMEIQTQGRSMLSWCGWTFLNVLTVLLLVGQFGWFNQAELSQQEELRGWYELLCDHLRCELLEFTDVTKIKTRKLVVRSHPDVDKALIVDAIIFNDSQFAQPFPLLALSFSDMENKLVASRRFKPAEYLAGELTGNHQMPAQTEVHLSLEIVDPGTSAVSYQLRVEKI